MEASDNVSDASPRIIKTDDTSHTLYVPFLGESYHSRYGAIQESQHVFIRNGFHAVAKKDLHVLEIGFGTGLNALLTLLEAEPSGRTIHYTALELYPLPDELVSQLNYCHLLEADEALFLRMHALPWDEEFSLTDHFVLHKLHGDLRTVSLPGKYDLVYFDAFSADVQPELWTPGIFSRLARVMNKQSILVTYAAKGIVRRALEQTGFRVERLPGPPGKREMIRAFWKDD